MTQAPVIAVPTSVGYGASLGGIAALLAMLNSCASGMAVVNIDNGFGAGHMAALINGKIEDISTSSRNGWHGNPVRDESQSNGQVIVRATV